MKQQLAVFFLAVLFGCSSSNHVNRIDDAQIQALPSSSQVVLLNFWATWCEPCRTEIPELNELHKKYPTVEFVGIDLDDLENEGAIEPFLKKHPIDYKVVLRTGRDFQAMASSIDADWKGGVPATFIFVNGKRIFSKIGVIDPTELDKILEKSVGKT